MPIELPVCFRWFAEPAGLQLLFVFPREFVLRNVLVILAYLERKVWYGGDI